jgi:1,4-dihydroxy-2-naphthoate octaprenyltransferase
MQNTMELKTQNLKLKTLFLVSRPQFLTASAAPVLVGSAIGFAVAGTFNWPLFLLALFGIMALQAGANITNDYFDHLSGNDWANKNITPFSGGSRFIQQGILPPKQTLFTGLTYLAIGVILGIVILLITRSIFILGIGLVGVLGAFFYTAPPVKLGYRGIGEAIIAFLFGILPVYGAYYLQTGRIDMTPLSSGCIVGILVFLIIFVNEFPDLPADASANKKTLVVRFGVPAGVWIYRIAVISTFAFLIAGAFANRNALWPTGLYFLFGLPAAVAAITFVNIHDVSTPGPTQRRACAITIIFHLIGCLALAAGFIIGSFVLRQMG